MKKLKKLLDTWSDGFKVRGMKTPPLETIHELTNIYYGTQKQTINGTVVEILEKCGIKTCTKGIGWIIFK